MTHIDLHLKFKRETGQYFSHTKDRFFLSSSEKFTADYTRWLEEQYLKEINK